MNILLAEKFKAKSTSIFRFETFIFHDLSFVKCVPISNI